MTSHLLDVHPRSNPATYTGVFDQIRDLFAATADAKARGYKKGRFSFNVKGRADVRPAAVMVLLRLRCIFFRMYMCPVKVCKGKRYNRETLEVKYKGKSIYDVLNMTVEEALYRFLKMFLSIRRKIRDPYMMWDFLISDWDSLLQRFPEEKPRGSSWPQS